VDWYITDGSVLDPNRIYQMFFANPIMPINSESEIHRPMLFCLYTGKGGFGLIKSDCIRVVVCRIEKEENGKGIGDFY
jgi:hypothetical protein